MLKMPEDFMKKSLMLISLVFLFAMVMPSQSFSAGVEFAVGVWEQSPQGQLSFENDFDNLDLEDDLNYDDETRLFARLKIDMPSVIPNIYLMATPMEFDGTGQKDVRFKFGDVEFEADIPFSSELILDHFDVALYYGIPGLELATAGLLNVEIGINVRIYDFEGTIVGDSFGVTVEESESFTAPIPMVYLAAQLRPLKKLAIEAEARGVIFGDDKVYSLIGRLKWKFLKPFFIAGGYRYDKIDIEEDDFTLDIDFSGVFGEAGFVF